VHIDAPATFDFVHRLRTTRRALDPLDPTVRDLIASGRPTPVRCLAVIDAGLARADPESIDRLCTYAHAYADSIRLHAIHIAPGGEPVKNDQAHCDAIVRAIRDSRLCRRSCVIAIGGGALLDAAGHAASLAHRGVGILRMPSTTLSQADSGVGVKHGINAWGIKNFLGGFAPPIGVVNDPSLLTTLSDRDWRCGFSEIVKVAIIRDAELFDRLDADARRVAARDAEASEPLIARSAELHLRHIVESGDPFETSAARPLDFGHWAAHRLEELSGFELRHGEAVALGIAIDSIYASLVGLLEPAHAERICACLESLGFTLEDAALARPDDLLIGIERFREHLGGTLTITLPTAIGRAIEVHTLDEPTVREAIAQVRSRDRRAAEACP